ncbi:SDR family NAD(P)-dependent oxidoreductase [Heyndrickxia coagulans]|uniref:SDR family NAD(P)-dependent oxidoreductase n=2 Tax=Bacillaceae TaxID=186817 RepID=UPI0021B44E11|nr:SDR family NAD(P)-dependent oxidoreductase [Heyndrickxia coagulans]UXC22438.1 SDR family NAD(P)-dependent oxidoreductase [Heyndrickxia coagulans]
MEQNGRFLDNWKEMNEEKRQQFLQKLEELPMLKSTDFDPLIEEFVKLFAKDGYNLVLVARSGQKLEEIKQSFTNVEVTVIFKDLSVPGAAKEVFEEVEKKGISINVLVNNAGFGLLGKFDELDIQKQLDMIQLNIAALTELTYYFLQQMKRRDSGKILNVASTATFQPGPLMSECILWDEGLCALVFRSTC